MGKAKNDTPLKDRTDVALPLGGADFGDQGNNGNRPPELGTPPNLPGAPVLPGAPTLPTPPDVSGSPIPRYTQPALDPLYSLLMQQSQEANITELMKRARDDQAMLLARYGTRLAQAGTGTGSPLLTR
jgi:hypothetical protein